MKDTVRVFDHSSNRYIDVVSLFDGRQLSDDADPTWRGAGSLQGISSASPRQSDFVTEAEARGRRRDYRGRHRGRGPSLPLTDAQIAGVKAECHTLKAHTLAVKYRMPVYRVREIVKAAKAGR